MAHDVFISHSHADKPAADAACAALEAKGIRCWIAPRDIDPGKDWAASIVEAIRGAQIMLLVFSRHANQSPQVKREVERAANSGKVLLPLRIEDVLPEQALEYYLGTPHWLDAITPPFEAHLEKLGAACSSLLEVVTGRSPQDATSGPAPIAPVVQQQPAELNLAPSQQRQTDRTALPEPRPAERPPPDTRTPPRQPWWRRKAIVIPAAVVTVALIPAVVGIPDVFGHHSTSSKSSPTPSQRSYAAQVVLPFTGLNNPDGVAVDTAGNLYVIDAGNNRVLELAAGSSIQTVLPFTGLSHPFSVAVDLAGNLYVADYSNSRVLKLPARSSTQEELPFTGLQGPRNVAVDGAGNLYVTDYLNNRVLKLAAGSSAQQVLPLTGLSGPDGVAADSAGNVYVTEHDAAQVLKLAVGSTAQQVLPFTGLNTPVGVAVDSAGNLYVTDVGSNQVLELAAGSSAQQALPFTDLINPDHVAVDSAGNLYVTDYSRVLKLPAA